MLLQNFSQSLLHNHRPFGLHSVAEFMTVSYFANTITGFLSPTADLMPLSDLKPLTAKYVYQVWQKEWDETVLVSDKFHEILPKLPDKLTFL